MKWLKIPVYAILLLLLLIAIAIGVFLATFDANQYKEDLSALVQQQTGRELTFSGDISLTLYPRLGMQLGRMEFANAKGFGAAPFFQVDQVSVFVDIPSLLKMQPEIAELVFDGAALDLQKNSAGVTNWDDLIARFASDEAPAEAVEEQQQEAQDEAETESAEADEALQIQGVFKGLRITNLRASWHDQQAGQRYELNRLDLLTSEIRPNEPFDLSLQVKASSGTDLQAAINFNSTVLFDLERMYLSLTQMVLDTEASGALLPVEQAKARLIGKVGFDLNLQQLSVNGFALEANTNGGLMQTIQAGVSGEISMNLANQNLNIGVLEVSATATDPSLPLGEVRAQITAQELRARLAQNQVDLQGFTVAINDQKISGNITANDFTVPDVEFALRSESFDVDKILGEPQPAPETPPEAEAEVESAPPEDVEIALPLELLRSLKIKGSLDMQAVEALNIRLQNFKLGLNANGGIIDLQPLAMDLYGGRFDADIQLDARGDAPNYQLRTELNNFQVGDFLTDFMDLDLISGATELEMQARTGGNWLSELKQNLNGNLRMVFRNGAVKGFNLRYLIDKAKSKFGGPEPDEALQQTDFTALSLSGAIRDGVFFSDDLELLSPLIRVGGEGQVDLVQNTLDYTVKAKVVGSLTGQDGGSINQLGGLLIPVNISGPFTGPKIDILLDELMKERARQELEAQKARIKEATDAAKAAAAKKLAEERAKLDAEKARLKQEQAAKEAALKAELEAKKRAQEEQLRAQQEAEKQRLQQELEAKKKAEEEALKQKLKSLF